MNAERQRKNLFLKPTIRLLSSSQQRASLLERGQSFG
jgi:hypothetical protein